MNFNTTVATIYFVSLGIWLMFVIISLRTTFHARSLSKRIGPVAIIFLIISAIIVLASVFVYLNLQNSTPNPNQSRSVQY